MASTQDSSRFDRKVRTPGAGRRAQFGHGQGQGRRHRHRRHPARQVPAQGQVPRRRRGRLRLLRRGVRLGHERRLLRQHHRSPAGSMAFPTRWRASTWRPRTVPWDDDVPFFLGDFVNADGTPHPICPRQTLKRVLKRAEKARRPADGRLEFEWFNFRETPQSWAAKKGVGPEPITPGMFGYSLLRMAEPARLLQRADGRDAGLRRADRRPAHRDRARRVRGGDQLLRGARSRRPRDPVQDRRQGDRRALRHHAELHGQVERAATRAAPATSTRACPTARRTSSTTQAPALA